MRRRGWVAARNHLAIMFEGRFGAKRLTGALLDRLTRRVHILKQSRTRRRRGCEKTAGEPAHAPEAGEIDSG